MGSLWGLCPGRAPSAKMRNQEFQGVLDFIGERGGTRTLDPMIKSLGQSVLDQELSRTNCLKSLKVE